jgi:hypothetical protein
VIAVIARQSPKSENQKRTAETLRKAKVGGKTHHRSTRMTLQESGDPVMGTSGDWKVNPGVELAKSLFFGVDRGRGPADCQNRRVSGFKGPER